MPTKYVWWDDKRKDPPIRMQLRVPTSLQSFTKEVADTHDISVNAFMVALLEWAYTADSEHKLVLDIGPNHIRLTPRLTPPEAQHLTSQSATQDRRFPYGKPKAR